MSKYLIFESWQIPSIDHCLYYILFDFRFCYRFSNNQSHPSNYRTNSEFSNPRRAGVHDEEEEEVAVGAVAQVLKVVQGCHSINGPFPGSTSYLTSTGITAPVLREKVRWPRTLRMLEISPEWEVKLIHVLSSVLKTSSNRALDLMSWASLVSA